MIREVKLWSWMGMKCVFWGCNMEVLNRFFSKFWEETCGLELWQAAYVRCWLSARVLGSIPRIWCLPECSYSHSPTHLHLELLLEVICASSIDVLKLGRSLCSKGAYSLVLSSRQELNIHFKRDLLWAWVNLILRRFVGAQITALWKEEW